MAKNESNIHVVPAPDGKWTVKNEGTTRALKRFDKQSDAVSHAVERARIKGQHTRSEVVIHKRDGTIREKNSYGSDPMPPRDNKR